MPGSLRFCANPMSSELEMLSKHLILCHHILLLPSVFLMQGIRVFPNKSALYIRWQIYWRFSICPSNEYTGLISFRIDWFDLLVVQGTLKSFLQHQNSQASILQYAAFFMVHLSHLSEKAIAAHSSTLAWKIPWIEEPGGLQSMGSQRVRHD